MTQATAPSVAHFRKDPSKHLVSGVRIGGGPHSLPMSQTIPRHLSINVDNVRRHERDSFARQVSYISRSVATNPRTGTTFDFRDHGPVEATGLEGWDGSIEELIYAATNSESERRVRVNEGRVAILALPHEISASERLRLARNCAQYLVTKFGVAVFFGIHPPPEDGDGRNWHLHVLFTARRVIEGRGLGKKTRELDSLQTGGGHIESFRSWWCSAMNTVLRSGGHLANVEHKSFARLGIEDPPTRHLGERQTAIDRKRYWEVRASLAHSSGRNRRLRVLPWPKLVTPPIHGSEQANHTQNDAPLSHALSNLKHLPVGREDPVTTHRCKVLPPLPVPHKNLASLQQPRLCIQESAPGVSLLRQLRQPKAIVVPQVIDR